MDATLAVVEIWPAIEELSRSSPLAGMARRRFGGKTLLEWVVRRISDAERVHEIVVLGGEDSLSHSLVEHCPPDVRVLLSPAADPLGRFADAVRRFKPGGVVRLRVNHPFVDPELIDRLVVTGANSGADYAGYQLSDCRPAIESKIGVFGEWCDAKAVLRAERLASRAADRADATRFLYSRPDLFTAKFVAAPSQLDRDDLRLAVQDEEDWEHVQIILDALGPESLDWQYIAALLDRQPAMRARMADRNRATVCP
jgi:spore coat polysaccharide biosynthesis protein SpsF (cytidylyltransferase family)